MRIYLARSNRYHDIAASRKPFLLTPDGDYAITFSKQPDPTQVNATSELTTTLANNEGAIVDVRFRPAEGYAKVTFGGCTEGVETIFGRRPERTNGWWVVYTKTLKREMSPIPLTF